MTTQGSKVLAREQGWVKIADAGTVTVQLSSDGPVLLFVGDEPPIGADPALRLTDADRSFSGTIDKTVWAACAPWAIFPQIIVVLSTPPKA